MQTFIKVIELWIPDRERTHLEFSAGLYGDLTDFQAISKQQRFAYGEGLPGQAWAQGHPLVLTQFEHSCFKRTQAAQRAGLSCGIAMPVFAGDFLLAVVVFLCGGEADHAGAIEVWQNTPQDRQQLQLMDGYYGRSLAHFEALSRTMRLSKGQTISGKAWASGLPILLEDLGQLPAFADYAAEQPITTGLSLPLLNQHQQCYVLTLLSANGTPLAKRIQIWVPDASGQQLICQKGYSKDGNNLAEMFETTAINKGEGALGRVWLTGMPLITGTQEETYNPELETLRRMLAIPVIEQGHLQAIVTFLF